MVTETKANPAEPEFEVTKPRAVRSTTTVLADQAHDAEVYMAKAATLPATTAYTADDGWAAAAASAADRAIRGPLLKFADFRWTMGSANVLIPDGSQYTALSCARAMVRWQGGKPGPYIWERPDQPFPLIEELPGMDDRDSWELDSKGEPSAPWRDSRFLYLIDNDAAVFTYTTSTLGGCGAITDLADQIKRMRTVYPTAVPVVGLFGMEMKTKHGRKSKPQFKVVRWVGLDAPLKQLESPTVAEEMDDEIPF